MFSGNNVIQILVVNGKSFIGSSSLGLNLGSSLGHVETLQDKSERVKLSLVELG